MDAKEAWNYLVSEYEKNFSAQEDKIQTLWESYLANPFLFGYSDSDDIDSKRSLHIGSTDREIPDIILRSNHNDICIIELKRYSLSKHSNYEKQLLNYMTHTDLHLSIGVLVCKTLNIYHFDHAKNATECLEIPFEKDSKNGETFISLISKSNFSEDKITNFIKSENESKENVRNLKSEITDELVKGLIIKHFENKYSANDIEKVLSELNISISEKSAVISTPVIADTFASKAKGKKDDTQYNFKGNEYGKGKLVLAVISDYVRSHPETAREKLKTIFPKKLQGSLEVVEDKEAALTDYQSKLAQWEQNGKKKNKPKFRFFKEELQLSNGEMYVTTEWGSGNIDRFIYAAKKLGYKITEASKTF